jgi:putative transposase
VIEDLSVKGMTASAAGTVEQPGKKIRQKAGLNRAMLDVGFGEFRRLATYKADWYGTTLLVADRWYPSSKLCPVCGTKNDVLTLKHRQWTCPGCDTSHDRDFNASVNLERLATATTGSSCGTTALPEAIGKVTSVSDE